MTQRRPSPGTFEQSASGLYWFVFVLTLAVLCLPMFLITYPPLVDYPNHLARTYILYHYRDIPLYQTQYVLAWHIIPNLAIDLIMPALLHFFDWNSASRLFLCLTVLSFAVGCHLLGTAIHGHRTWLAIPCTFFVYNSMLLYGFVNYVFSLGCFGWALAYWIRWRDRWTPWRLGAAGLLTLCAYIAHLSAYSFLVAAFITISAWDVWKSRASAPHAALSLVPVVPEVVLYCAQTIQRGGAGTLEWNSVSGKIIALLPLLLTYRHWFDLVFVVVLGVISAFALWTAEDSKIEWSTFLTGIVLFTLLLATPKDMLTGSGADARFFPPAALLLVLSVKVTFRQRTGGLLLLACLALFAVRVGSIWTSWSQMDKRIAEQVRFFSVLPEGARVYPAFPSPVVHLSKEERSLEHVISLATITRHAYVFSQFAIPGQQPVLFRTAPIYAPFAGEPKKWLASVKDAEYVWSYGLSASAEAVLASRCVPLGSRDGFTIWKVIR